MLAIHAANFVLKVPMKCHQHLNHKLLRNHTHTHTHKIYGMNKQMEGKTDGQTRDFLLLLWGV